MNIFDRYILKIYIKYILFVQFFILAVSTVVSAISHLDALKKYDITILQLFKLEMLTLPMGINSTLPIVIVVANIITVLVLMRSRELTAYVSLGGRIQRFLMPFILSSFAVAAFMIYFDNNIYPTVRFKQQRFLSEEIKKQSYSRVDNINKIWLMDENKAMIYIGLLNPLDNIVYNIKKYNLGVDSIIESIDSIKYAVYEDGGWVYRNINKVDLTGDIPKYTFIDKEVSPSEFLNGLTSISGRSPRELSPKDLLQMIKLMKQTGQNTVKYEMLLGTKIASALSVIVLTILVIPMGISFSRNYSPLKSSFMSFSLGSGFWATSAAFNSLGSSGVLTPFNANYLPHILFLFLGLYILKKRA